MHKPANSPIKVIGGQHRFEAIRFALENSVDVLHGVKVYFALDMPQRLLVVNTSDGYGTWRPYGDDSDQFALTFKRFLLAGCEHFDRTLRPLIPETERRSELSSSGRNIPHRQGRRHSGRLVSIPDAASLRDALREKYAAYSGRIESMQLALVPEQFVSSDFRFAVAEQRKRQDVLVLDTLHRHREANKTARVWNAATPGLF